jgi:hypothetical protein
MTIRKRAGAVLCTATAMAAVIGLAAAPAMAATTPRLTVKVGSGGTYTAKASRTVLSDNGVNVVCTNHGKTIASEASGKISSGTYKGKVPVKAGTAAKLSFGHCSGPLGVVTTKIKGTPYAVSADSKTNKKGETDAIISGIKVAVSMTGCTFNVTGSTAGYYTNSKHTLTMMTPTKKKPLPVKPMVNARLTVSGVKGCLGIVSNGNHPSYVSTYGLSRKISIKSS